MSDLLNKLKASTKNKLVNVLSESDVFNVKDCATTPIPALNLILSGDVLGGLPTGITTIAAPSAHFKTILGLFMVASYMRKYDDAVCIFYDSEGGVTQQTFESMGVSADRILHVPVSDIGQLRTEITNHLININRGDHVIIFIDSIGMLPSLKEVSDAEDGKNVADMTRAKDMGSLFRIMNAKSVVLNIPIVVVNAVYQTLEMYSKTEMKGGTGARYSSQQILYISKAKDKDGDELLGYRFRITANKSRYVREGESIPLMVSFENGISKWSGMFELAQEFGWIVSETRGWYQLCNKKTGEILLDKYRAKDLVDNGEIYLRLFAWGLADELKAHYTLSYKATFQGDFEIDYSKAASEEK